MAKRYTKEFKKETIRLIQEEGKTVAQVARERDLNENTFYPWISEFKLDSAHAFPGSGHLKPEDKALRDLQKELRELKEENEI